MPTDKLQEAISRIKSGDKQTGQGLLTEVLRTDPRNELAWLWMSTLVGGEKRRYCLEKALSINPQNTQARQQLEKLSRAQPSAGASPSQPPRTNPAPSTPPPFLMGTPGSTPSASTPIKAGVSPMDIPASKPVPSTPIKAGVSPMDIPASKPVPSTPIKAGVSPLGTPSPASSPRDTIPPFKLEYFSMGQRPPAVAEFDPRAKVETVSQHWLIPGRHMSTVIYMHGGELLSFDVLPDKAPQLAEQIQTGATPKQLVEQKGKYHLKSVHLLALSTMSEVRLFGESLTLVTQDDSGRRRTISITCDKENSDAIMTVLHQHLGPRFQSLSRPIPRLRVMRSSIVLFLIALAGTSFFYWLVQGLADEERIAGSARARAIANLLLSIGPSGVLCIGGGVLVLLLVGMVSSLTKPPDEKVLIRG